MACCLPVQGPFAGHLAGDLAAAPDFPIVPAQGWWPPHSLEPKQGSMAAGMGHTLLLERQDSSVIRPAQGLENKSVTNFTPSSDDERNCRNWLLWSKFSLTSKPSVPLPLLLVSKSLFQH